MEKLKLLPVHEHPLLPFTRFHRGSCTGCTSTNEFYFYGGYICNELDCDTIFHTKCAELVQEINHYSHPNHSLKLVQMSRSIICSLCRDLMTIAYSCSICDFNLDLDCARLSTQQLSIVDFEGHAHQVLLTNPDKFDKSFISKSYKCKVCDYGFYDNKSFYHCIALDFLFHVGCVGFFPQGYHTSHPKHPLKLLTSGLPDYSDKKCLLCEEELKKRFHHCDVCNFSICRGCMGNSPPLEVISLTTHEHTLHLVPRIIEFTCNACGTQGDRSPYFCLQCNFMIHRDCIDLPRVININRHDHRISYTSYLGQGNWTCGVCRKIVDGFYGGYLCSKCPSYVVHSRCATSYNVWDTIELEGTPEEIEMEPFEVIDDDTIKHFSHDHNLKHKKDGKILQENILCEACAFQIYDDPFYSCEQCDFILHETCANLRLKKRNVADSVAFALDIDINQDSSRKQSCCSLCQRYFTGFKYITNSKVLDVRCGSFSEPFFHKSHSHPLYYKYDQGNWKYCESGKNQSMHMLCCDECSFTLNFWWAFLPEKVMRKRYDDHPLFLSYGENNVSSIYWCDVCETKLDPKKWFYTCDDCGITLHVSCVVGDFSFHKPGRILSFKKLEGVVVANTCICRPNCVTCGSRCIFPFILKLFKPSVDLYFCSQRCFREKSTSYS